MAAARTKRKWAETEVLAAVFCHIYLRGRAGDSFSVPTETDIREILDRRGDLFERTVSFARSFISKLRGEDSPARALDNFVGSVERESKRLVSSARSFGQLFDALRGK